jgi:hypothetical protein
MLIRESVGDDRLEGAEEIAKFIGVPIRRARYLIERGQLPVAWEGRRLIASKSVLREYWVRLTRADPIGPDTPKQLEIARPANGARAAGR